MRVDEKEKEISHDTVVCIHIVNKMNKQTSKINNNNNKSFESARDIFHVGGRHATATKMIAHDIEIDGNSSSTSSTIENQKSH